MLPKKARLSSNQLSFTLRRPTAKLFSPHITLIYHAKEATPSVVSFGVALPKRLFHNSVDMHRKRRIVYARIRESGLSRITSDSLLFVVLIPKESFFQLSPLQQKAEIYTISQKLQIQH